MKSEIRESGTFWARVGLLAQRLAVKSPPAPGAPPKAGARAAPSPPPTDIAASFVRRLRQIVDSGGASAVGAVHVISLADMRTVLEKQGRWQMLAPRVEAVCAAVIGQRLDGADVMQPLPGPAFFIAFARVSPDAARAKCALIAQEIERRLLGDDPALDGVHVTAGVLRLDQDEVTIDDIDHGAGMGDLAARADTTIVGAPAVALPSGPSGEPESPGNDDPLWRSLERENYAFDNPWVVRIGRTDGVAAKEKGDWYYEGVPSTCPVGLTYVYVPMWHVRDRAVGTYLCLPAIPVSDEDMLVGDAIYAAAPPLLVCKVDIDILLKVEEDVTALLQKGQRAILSVPVHFETLARPRERRAYLAACAGLSDEVQRHIAIELVDLPEGAPAGRIAELLAYLYPFTARVGVRTSLSQSRFDLFSAARIFAVGVAIGREPGSETEIISRMNSFVHMAERAKLPTYAFEIGTRSLAVAARGAGFNYISGSTIGAAMESPEAAYRFETLDLFAGLLA